MLLICAKPQITNIMKKNISINSIVQFDTLSMEFNIPHIIHNNQIWLLIHNYLLILDLLTMSIIHSEPILLKFNDENNTIIAGNFIIIDNNVYFFGSLNKSGGIILDFKNKISQHMTYGILNVSYSNDSIMILNEANEYILLNRELQKISENIGEYTKTINYINSSFIFNKHYVYLNINNQCVILNNHFIPIKTYNFESNHVSYMQPYKNHIVIADDYGIYTLNTEFQLTKVLQKDLTHIININDNLLIATYRNKLYEINIETYLIEKEDELDFIPVKIGYINNEYIWIIHIDKEGNYTISIYNMINKKYLKSNIIFNTKLNIITTSLFKNKLKILYLNTQNILEYITIIL